MHAYFSFFFSFFANDVLELREYICKYSMCERVGIYIP